MAVIKLIKPLNKNTIDDIINTVTKKDNILKPESKIIFFNESFFNFKLTASFVYSKTILAYQKDKCKGDTQNVYRLLLCEFRTKASQFSYNISSFPSIILVYL